MFDGVGQPSETPKGQLQVLSHLQFQHRNAQHRPGSFRLLALLACSVPCLFSLFLSFLELTHRDGQELQLSTLGSEKPMCQLAAYFVCTFVHLLRGLRLSKIMFKLFRALRLRLGQTV